MQETRWEEAVLLQHATSMRCGLTAVHHRLIQKFTNTEPAGAHCHPLPLPAPPLQLRQTQFGVVSATTYFTRAAGPFVVPLVLYIASYVLL